MTVDARTWAADHAAALVGLPSGAAEQEVEDAGLRARVAVPGLMLTLDFRPDRVTLVTDGTGVVTEVRPG
ncbi:I78 family peptidase inhibitor [Amnibacterium kyonggiense]